MLAKYADFIELFSHMTDHYLRNHVQSTALFEHYFFRHSEKATLFSDRVNDTALKINNKKQTQCLLKVFKILNIFYHFEKKYANSFFSIQTQETTFLQVWVLLVHPQNV